jgi:hypothetical protein
MLDRFSGSPARRAVFAACAAAALLVSTAFACPALGIERATSGALSTASWLVAALAISALLEDVLHENVLALTCRHLRQILRLS